MRVTDPRVRLDPQASIDLYLNVLAVSTLSRQCHNGYVLACLLRYNDNDPSVVANRRKAF